MRAFWTFDTKRNSMRACRLSGVVGTDLRSAGMGNAFSRFQSTRTAAAGPDASEGCSSVKPSKARASLELA